MSAENALSPRQVFGRRVKEARKRRGWYQEHLASRLAEIGYPELRREIINRIETGKRANVSLDDVLAIAAALDCAPIHLIVPIDDDELVQVTEGLPPARAEQVREWVRGTPPALRLALEVAERNADDLSAFMSQQPASWISRTMLAMGYTEDDVEDALASFKEGAPVWLTGRPPAPRQKLVEGIAQAEITAAQAEINLAAKRELLKRYDQKKGGNDA